MDTFMTSENPDNETLKIAQRFLDVDGMQDTVISLLMPTILDELKKVGIDQQPTVTNTNGVHNQTSPNGVDPIQFPEQNIPTPPAQVNGQQKIQLDQVVNLLQVLGPFLGPLLGLTPAQNTNTNGLQEGMKIYNEFEQIKRNGQNDILEIMSTLTGTIVNRTDRDPAEVLGNLSNIKLDRNRNETSN